MKNIIHLEYTTVPTPVPDFVYTELKKYVGATNFYYSQPDFLRSKLAAKHDVSQEMIFLTAGADEAIQLFAKKFGKNTFIFTPTYGVYMDAEIFGGKVTQIYALKSNEYVIPTDSLPNDSLLFVANPNNPCGFTEIQHLITLIKNNPTSIIVIDEAYGDFNPELSFIPYLSQYPNVAVLRTFSKGYGIAGARVGYILANPEILNKIRPLTQWANVSYLSIGAAYIALAHESHFHSMRKQIVSTKNTFISFLRNKNFSVHDSLINAVLIRLKSEAEAESIYSHLLKNNILSNHGNGNSTVGLDKTFIRIAIGTPEQMLLVQKCLE